MEALAEAIAAPIIGFLAVLKFPISPESRLFWLYLLSSVVMAYFIYRAVRARRIKASESDAEFAEGSFLAYLFPRRVWSHPSAWLDVKYLVFHRTVAHVVLLAILGGAVATSYKWVSGGQSLLDSVGSDRTTSGTDWLIALAFMSVMMLFLDFLAYVMHVLQHKVPVLWQFHKVHHSAEVMHPMSNFREHPIDNAANNLLVGLGYGALQGAAVRWLGYVPTVPTLLGVPVFMFLFNVVGYNLRHSHIWLRWPGIWSKIFPSPAHHHVHHSRHPDHIDKNFAFMFPIWDVLFGTYILPEDNRDVEFGIHEKDARDLDGVLKLYWVPFRDAFRVLRPRKSAAPTELGEEKVDPVASRED